MASSVHPFQQTQAYGSSAPPPNYSSPGAYGTPNGGAPPGYGYGAPNGAVYGSAPPPGYATNYPPNNGAQGYPPPGVYAYAPPPGSAPGYPNTMPPDSAPGYPNGAPPPDGVQPFAYSAPGAVGYPPVNGGAQGYPPVNGGAPGYAYGAPNGAPGYPPANGGSPAYPTGGAPQHPVAGASGNGYVYAPNNAMYNSGVMQATGYPPGDGKTIVSGEYVHRAQMDPRDQIQTGRWAAGLCSCGDFCIPNCIMPWCCPCVSLAQVYARMGLQPYLMSLAQFTILYIIGLVGYVVPSKTTYVYNYSTYSYETTSTSIGSTIAPILIMLTRVIFCVMVWRGRAAVRTRFEIPGNCCADCLASFCCSCCAIAQMATHVKSYKPGSCSFDGPDVLPPYTR